MAQVVKNLPAVKKTWVQSLDWEESLEEGMANHSSILSWRIPIDRGAWHVIGFMTLVTFEIRAPKLLLEIHCTELLCFYLEF